METSHIKGASIISRGTRKQQENKISAFLSAVHMVFFFSSLHQNPTAGAAASRPLQLKVFKRSVARPDLVASNERWSSETDKWRKKKDVVTRSEIGGGHGEGGGDERREEQK